MPAVFLITLLTVLIIGIPLVLSGIIVFVLWFFNEPSRAKDTKTDA